jgi:hypothetical protein
MFQNITSSSLWSDASLEIIAMLLWAFLLWILFSHIIRPCNKKPKQVKTPLIPMSAWMKTDDLQLIEWIWPALEKVLQNNWVRSYKDIISLDIWGLEELLESLGWRYASYNPTTWPDQAELAKRKKWSELEEYQEIMKNSKIKSS